MGKSSTDATALTPDVDKGRKRKEKDKLEAEAAAAEVKKSKKRKEKEKDKLEAEAAAAALEVEKSNKKEKGKLEAAPPEVEKSKKKKDKSKKRKEAEAHTKGDVLEYNGDCKAGQSPIPDEMKRKRKRESGAATSSAGEDTEGLDGSKGGEKLMAAEDESTKKNGKDEQSPAPTTETQVKTLFVGNMGLDTNVEQILSLFTRHGIDVSDCMLPCHEGSSRGFCYIDCASAVDANKAIATLCGYKYKGQPLVVELSKQNLTEMRNMFSISNRGLRTTVLVSGFEPTAEDHLKKSLRIHFAECDISRIRVVISQGKAYLDFNDNDSFCKAIDLDGSVIDGRPITVTEATSRAPGAGPAYFCVLCGGGGIFCTTCGADIGGTCSHLEHSRTNTDPNTNLAGSSQAGHETNTRNKERTVYVRKLDMRFGKEQMHKALENLFSKCGRMTDIRIPASDDGAIRGYGFIEFEDKKSALKALELDGARIGRLKLSVREFREPQSTAGS